MNLYELATDITAIISADAEGELTPEALERLEALEIAFSDKLDACCKLIRQWEMDNVVRQAEMDRLAAGRAGARNRIAGLKAWMQQGMNAARIESHKSPLFSLWIQNDPPSVIFDGDPAKLPPEFQRIKVEADKAEILKCWKESGAVPEGVEIKTDGESLRIR